MRVSFSRNEILRTCGTIVRRNENACSECGVIIESKKKTISAVLPPAEHTLIANKVTGLRRTTAQVTESVLVGFSTYLSAIVCIGALLLATFFDWPYAFYVALRLVVCSVSLYWAVQMFKKARTFWLGRNAFCLVIPWEGAVDWEIINLLDAAFLASWIAFSIYRERRQG